MAEFLSHYYVGRLRPVSGYTMGLIHRGAGLAAHAQWLANFVMQTPVLRDVVKRLCGIAPARQLPAFAPPTFKQQFPRRVLAPTPGITQAETQAVMPWPHTFNSTLPPQMPTPPP